MLGGRVGRGLQIRSRRSNANFGLVLLHHEIAPTQGSRDELLPALGADAFRAQLRRLQRSYDVVPLAEILERTTQRSAGDPIPVAITFDDDLSNHAAVAAPILEEFGFPATFFLCGRSLGGPLPFWEQDLKMILSRGAEACASLEKELTKRWPWARLDGHIAAFTATVKALPPAQRDEIAARLRELVGPQAPDEGLSRSAVKNLADTGFEIGFHTLRHYSLPTLDDEQLEIAMQEGLDDLSEVIGYRPRTIAYPYADGDLRVAEAARKAGFETGFVLGHAPLRADQHPFLLARFVAMAESQNIFDWGLGLAGGTR